MTIEEKAQAFDLIMDGTVTGMSLFWKRLPEFQTFSDQSEILRSMASLAAEEAIETIQSFED